jgi:putative transposase
MYHQKQFKNILRSKQMQRTNIVELIPNKKQEKILKECMLLSSCVYNMTNFIMRQRLFKQEKSPSFFELQQSLQNKDDYKNLGRSYALPRIQIYSETNNARFKLIKSKKQSKVGLPKYLKNRKTNTTIPSYLVIDNCQYHIGKKKITIPLSRQMRKKYNVKHFDIEYNGILKWKGKQQRGQIHYDDGKFYLYQSVEIETPKIKKNDMIAGVDLGIKRLFGIAINNKNDYLIGGERFFKQWKYYEDKIAKEKQILSYINRKTSKKLSKLYSQRNKWQNNLYNNVVAKMFRIFKRNNISTLFVGDVKNIRENNDKGTLCNQMLHNYWAFDKLYHKMTNKAEENGIEMIKITEEYTSQRCPICGDICKDNKKDRIFICSFCGYIDHRDIVGAKNIMFKGMDSLQSIHRDEIIPLDRGCVNAISI